LTRILFIRHGKVYNPENILYGRLPGFHLDTKGLVQASETGRKLKKQPISGIFSSPLLRARQTAREILRFHPHLKLRQSILINEVYTPFEGWKGEALRSRKQDFYTGVQPPFEKPADILNRAQAFIHRIRKRFFGKQVAAVTHGDVILFTILWAKGFPVTGRNKIRFTGLGLMDTYPENASITTLSYKSGSLEETPAVLYYSPKSGEEVRLS